MKPILFNTEMTVATMDNRKTATRRLVKPQPVFREGETGTPVRCDDGSWCFKIDQYHEVYDFELKPPYQTGDVLYVREAWRIRNLFGDWNRCDRCAEIEYRAGGQNFVLKNITRRFEDWQKGAQWLPSIHMPRVIARTFLRVTDVKLQRLKEITPEEAVAEGAVKRPRYMRYGGEKCLVLHSRYIDDFAKVWDSTVSKADMDTYGWEANPWVWVIEFQRIGKNEALKEG